MAPLHLLTYLRDSTPYLRAHVRLSLRHLPTHLKLGLGLGLGLEGVEGGVKVLTLRWCYGGKELVLRW